MHDAYEYLLSERRDFVRVDANRGIDEVAADRARACAHVIPRDWSSSCRRITTPAGTRGRGWIGCGRWSTACAACGRRSSSGDAGTGLAFDDVRIVLVDDGSPTELATLLPPDAVTSVDVLRLDTRRGQGAALNAALKTHRASAYAFTDSDCVVAPDWITTIDKLAATDDGTDGAAGPPWPHRRRRRSRKAAWLTRHETALIQHCTSRALRHGSDRSPRLPQRAGCAPASPASSAARTSSPRTPAPR